jgi:hypothetical protein
LKVSIHTLAFWMFTVLQNRIVAAIRTAFL